MTGLTDDAPGGELANFNLEALLSLPQTWNAAQHTESRIDSSARAVNDHAIDHERTTHRDDVEGREMPGLNRRVSRVARLAAQLANSVLHNNDCVQNNGLQSLAALPHIDDPLGVDAAAPLTQKDVIQPSTSARYRKYIDCTAICSCLNRAFRLTVLHSVL